MTKQDILMLGGTRFIGTALIVKLHSQIRDQAHLTCFHRGLHMENFPDVDGFVSHVTGDRHRESDVAALFQNDWDLVIDVSGTDETMTDLSMRLARNRCQRYVFVSSSSVYSTEGDHPHREDEPLLTGTGEPYAAAKIRAERLLREWHPHHTIIRPSKVYGPRNYYFSERGVS